MRRGAPNSHSKKAAEHSRPPAVHALPFEMESQPQEYLFRLYVAGTNQKSRRAIQISRGLCSSFPGRGCRLEVIDIYQQPGLARQDDIIAVPALVKVSPPPRRAFVGVVGDTSKILTKLGIPITEYRCSEPKAR